MREDITKPCENHPRIILPLIIYPMEIQKNEYFLFKHVANEKSDRELKVSMPKRPLGEKPSKSN